MFYREPIDDVRFGAVEPRRLVDRNSVANSSIGAAIFPVATGWGIGKGFGPFAVGGMPDAAIADGATGQPIGVCLAAEMEQWPEYPPAGILDHIGHRTPRARLSFGMNHRAGAAHA